MSCGNLWFFHVGACYLLNGVMAGSWFYVCQTTKHWNLMTWKKHALFNVILDQHWYHLILMNVKTLFKLITNLKRVRCLFPYSQHRVWLPKQSHTHTYHISYLWINWIRISSHKVLQPFLAHHNVLLRCRRCFATWQEKARRKAEARKEQRRIEADKVFVGSKHVDDLTSFRLLAAKYLHSITRALPYSDQNVVSWACSNKALLLFLSNLRVFRTIRDDSYPIRTTVMFGCMW